MSHFSRPGPSQAAGQGGDSDDEDPWGANGHVTRAYNVKLDEPTSGAAGRSGSPVTSDPRALLDLLPVIYGQVWQICRRCEAGSSDEEESISIGQMNRMLRSAGAGASVVEAIITLACQSARVSTHEHILCLSLLSQAQDGLRLSVENVTEAIEEVINTGQGDSYPFVPTLDLNDVREACTSMTSSVSQARIRGASSGAYSRTGVGTGPASTAARTDAQRREGLPIVNEPDNFAYGGASTSAQPAAFKPLLRFDPTSTDSPSVEPLPRSTSGFASLDGAGPSRARPSIAAVHAAHLLPALCEADSVSVRLRKETGGIYFLRHTLYSISSTYAAQDEATALLFGSTASASVDVSSKNRRKSWRPSSTSGDPDGLSGASEKWNVVRRYSDFTWLANCLIKRYPFRLLPILPPKRISIPIGGKQIAGSDPFLEARRRGLQRYLRAIVTHPVLRGDGLVRAFLTEKDSLTDWRLAQQTSSAHLLSPFTSTTSVPESLALVEECLSPCLSLPSSALTSQAIPEVNEVQTLVSAFKARNALLVERWSHLCIVFERLARRLEGLGLDHGRFSLALASLNETLSTRHSGPSADEERTVERTKKVTNSMESLTNSNQDFADLCSARASKWLDTLDGLKYQRDQHQAARDLVSRYEKLIPDNVGTLQKRIQASQKRQRDLASLISAPSSTTTDNGAEAESNRLAQSIAEDRGQVDRLMRRREHARLVLHVELRRLLPSRESGVVDVVRHHAREDLGLIAAETLAAEELVRSLLGA
ncbi:hypothetical protein IE81DRAFT_347019 [Ceraceosorus guamensis]|uniref:Sorting nexin MVP1 n=1 Tax=Ceraceosorus guamensis TaxID=1522189 RepID=A0A316VZY6_9BASI|nr:hypothetical protein IE81DRAFT_347019 [Ceraceosorus guamensis]PWN42834.1 hypothetical protein IE81DRAFT_347019 [Ceraceosorus guamensis]